MRLSRVIEVFRTFLGLGCIGFGGPVAHMALFRETFVQRRGWLREARFADLLAVAQALPGPASSQLGFAIGIERAGVLGGVAAWLAFTLPSATLMTAAALGWSALEGEAGTGCVRGLKAAAVGVVAHAWWRMAGALAADVPRGALAMVSAALVMAWDGPLCQLAVIALGACAGAWWLRGTMPDAPTITPMRIGRRAAGLAMLVAALAIAVPWKPWSAFARSGALTFGGGHVVLPLLESRLVHEGGLDAGTFLAGYALAQAIPGPLFTFAGFAAAAAPGALSPIAAAVVALLAIFVPGLSLMLAALALLPGLRRSSRAQAALAGVHAAVVGLLLAALLGPVRATGLMSVPTCAIAVATMAMLACTRWPVPLLMALAGAAGWWVAGAPS